MHPLLSRPSQITKERWLWRMPQHCLTNTAAALMCKNEAPRSVTVQMTGMQIDEL